ILRPLPHLRVTREPRLLCCPQPNVDGPALSVRGSEHVEPEPCLLPRKPRGDVLGKVGPVVPAIERGGCLLPTGLKVERPRLRQWRLPERPPPDPRPIFVGQVDTAAEVTVGGRNPPPLGCPGRGPP